MGIAQGLDEVTKIFYSGTLMEFLQMLKHLPRNLNPEQIPTGRNISETR